ncbi:Protein fem-1-like A-B [Colletotrichum gloeosporioides]|uniref:Protein fem-1-like A-B n=1 Tax=Colletotrichum gloeosporioides TaxID=474922 RepID=A0A8H4CVG1_COLGL|nr:Protein fem-1-like A-B [Colletotrichum gloeosporioides]KAF3810601.1 Protein fem-1-like A-B [Colletotrichum gloeosporioides]
MAGSNASVLLDTAALTELVVNNGAGTNMTANSPKGGDDGGSASVLRKLLEDMAMSREGARDAKALRKWIRSRAEEGIREDLNMTDSEGSTLLHVAARQGLAEAVKRLLAADAKLLDAQDDFGNTALLRACWRGHTDIVENLLKNGANAKLLDVDDWSPLFMAVKRGYRRMTELLLAERKWDLDFKEKFSAMTPLHAAASKGYKEIVRLLRDNGARLDLRDKTGRTPLMTATIHRRKDTMVELLTGQHDEDLQLETEDLRGRTPLLMAAQIGFWDGVHILVESGAKCDKPEISKTGETDPFITRSKFKAFKIEISFTIFLQQGIQGATDFLRTEEDTALHIAVWRNDFQMARFLLEHGANINARDHEGSPSLHMASVRGNEAILKLLLDDENCNHLNFRDQYGMTPLHLASCTDWFDDNEYIEDVEPNSQNVEAIDNTGLGPVFKAGQYNEVVHHLLAREADTTVLTEDGKTAVELAFDRGYYDRGEAILKSFSQSNGGTLETLMWAAGKTERHEIAKSLIKRRLKEAGKLVVDKTEGWTSIEWAAYARETRALWLLIASSPQRKETKRILKSAKAIVEGFKTQGEKLATNPDTQETNQVDDTKKHNKDGTTQEILDIINNPPTGLICRDISTYNAPKDEDRLPSSDSYHATIVQFYKRQGKFDSIIRAPTIKETIYGQGPAGIMYKVVDKLKGFAKSHLSGLEESDIVQGPIFMDSKPKFTWIHLPATNHLLQRIMRDENQPVSHFNQAKAFFKDSWIEVPDKVSPSRVMRPRFLSRNTEDDETQNEDTDKIPERDSDDHGAGEQREGSKDAKKAHGSDSKGSDDLKRIESEDYRETAAPSVAVTAIYMPYLTYSFQCDDEIGYNNEGENETESSQNRTQREKKLSIIKESTPSNLMAAVQQIDKDLKYVEDPKEKKEVEYTKKLFKARKTYQKLLDEFKGKTIHGSSTLDESYYHFGEDPESAKDKVRRNKSQVVTDIWRTEELGSYWLLVRVNQLWVWTINNRWLISASSHPIDDGEDELLNGILDRLEKQGEGGGSDLQPGSTAEMSQLIVDYCVDSYERKPKGYDDERPEDCKLKDFPSIRQTFSKSINSIARGETNMFEKFSNLTKKLRERSHDKIGEHNEAVQIMNEELTDATIEAEDLSSRVKDILDELSILESTVQYQQDVQRAMKKQDAQKERKKPDAQGAVRRQNVLETDLTTTYILNDIKGLGSVAQRVHAAVNATLSLQQSEIANLQARLSIEQAKLSIQHAELATRQGRVLMVFTVVTILFVSYFDRPTPVLAHRG